VTFPDLTRDQEHWLIDDTLASDRCSHEGITVVGSQRSLNGNLCFALGSEAPSISTYCFRQRVPKAVMPGEIGYSPLLAVLL
jgi:hypothetical protein